ncbi:hypothetical protein PC116_g15058 [Phytophthora cactorum]|nr:hypothetical protein PC114_g10716 [Phytophthora cactorum]KAG3013455.1 hypothetical protein PC120_g13286 [Phytophthora cactorum]KAG3015381.1 hypothetical protein PC119_g11807 [Phytophthora cactorum]KAG3174954.1 hypothetical protein C6341_g9661 [Phytophthora cactorum]KAG4236863.1 hypothetical protein PC116_g15058 [Phytophthora cactorum]
MMVTVECKLPRKARINTMVHLWSMYVYGSEEGSDILQARQANCTTSETNTYRCKRRRLLKRLEAALAEEQTQTDRSTT